MKDVRVHMQLASAPCSCNRDGWETARERPLRFIVPYTAPEPVKAALQAASTWAENLGAEILLLAVRQVPFQLPLDQPDFQPELFLKLLESLTHNVSCPVRIRLVLTRDKRESLRQLIPSTSMVVIATEERWRRTEEERLARFLSHGGRDVSLLTYRRHEKGLLAPEPPEGVLAPHSEKVKASHA